MLRGLPRQARSMEPELPDPPTGGRTPQAEEGERPQMVQGAVAKGSGQPAPDPSRGGLEGGDAEKEETRGDLR